jgi:hypothetical protein
VGLTIERTAFAWQRSAASFAVIAGTMAAVVVQAHTALAQSLASIVLTGVVAVGVWRHGERRYRRRLRPGDGPPTSRSLTALSAATLAVALAAAIMVPW